jgi:hypothetical protein
VPRRKGKARAAPAMLLYWPGLTSNRLGTGAVNVLEVDVVAMWRRGGGVVELHGDPETRWCCPSPTPPGCSASGGGGRGAAGGEKGWDRGRRSAAGHGSWMDPGSRACV